MTNRFGGWHRGARADRVTVCPPELVARGCGLSIPITDCLRCGVCCHSNLDTYVRVTGADWDRLGVDAERVAHFIGNRAYMKMSAGGHCAALEVRADAAGGREFFCTVYEKRPQVCRDLARGSPECGGERASKGARVHPVDEA